MTLATRILILSPVPVEGLYQTLDAMVRRTPEPSQVIREGGVIRNEIGQGNRSMLDITYGDLKAQPGQEQYLEDCAEYDEEPAPILHRHTPPVDHYAEVYLDTAYGYDEPGIGNCNDLHAAMILAAHFYAAEHGSETMWYDEYRGVWNTALDGLDEFASAGRDAQSWFYGAVLPVLEAEAAVLDTLPEQE